MSRSLGFGFIGAGAIAHFHARAVAASNGGRLVGVVSRTRASAEKFAAEHGIGFASDDVDQLLAQPGLDAVCITTPSALHLVPALAAIRASADSVHDPDIAVRSRLTTHPFDAPIPFEILVHTGDSTQTQSGVPRGVRRTSRWQWRCGPNSRKIRQATPLSAGLA